MKNQDRLDEAEMQPYPYPKTFGGSVIPQGWPTMPTIARTRESADYSSAETEEDELVCQVEARQLRRELGIDELRERVAGLESKYNLLRAPVNRQSWYVRLWRRFRG